MKKLLCFKFIVIILMTFVLSNTQVFANNVEDKNAQIIVKYVSGTIELNVEGVKSRKFLTDNIEIIEFETTHMAYDAIAAIEMLDGVDYVQENYTLKAYTYNDKYFNSQWGVYDNDDIIINIGAEAAWNITNGSSEVKIGILDNSIDINHEDLVNNIYTNPLEIPNDGVDNDNNGYIDDVNGYDFYNNSSNMTITNDNHATHMAGIIGAAGNNVGIRGIANNSKLVPLKFANGNFGYTSDAIEAILYAEQLGVNIINFSYGSDNYNKALFDIINDSNMLFVCAAGNNGNNKPVYPACYDLNNVVSVGAINNDGTVWTYSNYGESVDIYAPGCDVLTTFPMNNYATISGTSAATAYVTGAAALISSNESNLTASDIKERLLKSANQLVIADEKVVNAGVLDINGALNNIVAEQRVQAMFFNADDETSVQNYQDNTALALATEVVSGDISALEAQELHYGDAGVNPATGCFTYNVVDFNVESPGQAFVFERSFNSLDKDDFNSFGLGWSSILDSRITLNNLEITITMPNGSKNKFENNNGVYVSKTTRNKLSYDSANNQYVLTTLQQEKYIYSKYASFYRLTKILDKTDSVITELIRSQNGFTSKIIDSAGREYTVVYDGFYVTSITDSFGNCVYYNYGERNTNTGTKALRSTVDIAGNKTRFYYVFYYEDEVTEFLDTIYVNDKPINEVEYYGLRSDENYGKVLSYKNQYLEEFTYDYKYMYTNINSLGGSGNRTEYYDSFYYIYNTVYPCQTNEVTGRRYFRTANTNYGEVLQELSNVNDWSYDVTTYERDNEGNVTKKVNPDGTEKNYWYDDNNNLIAEFDECNGITLYVYNANNLMTLKAQYLGSDIPEELQPTNIESFINSNSADFIIEQYQYVSGDTYNCHYDYLLSKYIDGEGNETSYTYNKFGDISQVIHPHQETDTKYTETFEQYIIYTTDGQELMYCDYVDYVPDSSKKNVGIKKVEISPEGIRTEKYYDNNQKLFLQTIDDDVELRNVYDKEGKIIYEIDGLVYSSNSMNNAEIVSNYTTENRTYYIPTISNINNYLDYIISYTYNTTVGPGFNCAIEKRLPVINNTQQIFSYEYLLGRNNVSHMLTPDGKYYRYTYDALSRKLNSYLAYTKANGTQSDFKISEQNYIKATKSKRYIEYVRNTDNASLWGTNPFYTENEYDYRGNVVSAGKLSGTIGKYVYESYVFNDNGTLKKYIDFNGNASYYVYDSVKREIERFEPLYSRNGIDYYRHIVTEYYKNNNKKKEYVSKVGVQLPLGADGNISASLPMARNMLTVDGDVITTSDYLYTDYTYCTNGKLQSEISNDGTSVIYKYDGDGNIIEVDKNDNVVLYEYNARNMVVSETKVVDKDNIVLDSGDNYVTLDNDKIGIKKVYEYDGKYLKKEIESDGSYIEYGYDSLGRNVSETKNTMLFKSDGTTVNGAVKHVNVLRWDGEIIESQTYEITNNTATQINKVVHHEPEQLLLNQYILYAHKVEEIDCANPINNKVTLYLKNYKGKDYGIISPENYNVDAVVDANDIVFPNSRLSAGEMPVTVFEYDAAGRLISTTSKFFDCNNNNKATNITTVKYTYDNKDNILSETDAEGNVTKYYYQYDGNKYLIRDGYAAANAFLYSEKTEYDAYGRKTAVYDGLGNKTTYTYDDANHIITESVNVGDAQNPDNINKVSEYDVDGNLVKEYVNSTEKAILYEYNELGQLVKAVYPGDDTVAQLTVLYYYDVAGNMVKEVHNGTKEIIYSYDFLGNVISKSIGSVNGNDKITESTVYNSLGKVGKTTDFNGNVTLYVYDGFGRLTQKLDGKNETYSYDKNNNMISKTDWNQRTETYEYDDINRLVKIIGPDNVVKETLYYNKNGLQIKSVDALGNETEFLYDQNNRLVNTIDPCEYSTEKLYDNAGRFASEKDGNGNVTTFEYDSKGRVIKSIQNGIEQQFSYDCYDNLISQTNGNGHSVTWEYNVCNLPSKKIYEDDKFETYDYDCYGNMISKTDRNNSTVNYTYDIYGNNTGVSGTGINITKAYDNMGNVITMTDESGATSKTYDRYGRVLTQNVSGVGTVTYSYDNITGMTDGKYYVTKTDNNSNVIKEIYDANDRLSEVVDNNEVNGTVYTYYNDGRRASLTNPNGTSSLYEYFANGKLKTLTNKSGETVVEQYSYTYDAAGNQLSKTETIEDAAAVVTSYEYDALNRLNKVTEGADTVTEYVYDNAGNRTKQTVTKNNVETVTDYMYDLCERMLSATATTGEVTETTEYRYDNNGNLYSKVTSIIKPADSAETSVGISVLGENSTADVELYTFDALNRLVKVQQGGNTIINTYNGDGERISKISNGNTLKYLYDYGKILLEVNADGTIAARNINGHELLSREQNNIPVYYMYNGHGDVTRLTDGSGATKASYVYDAFGTIVSETGTENNPYRYAGYEYDTETGYYYCKARYYDSRAGRFISEDPYWTAYNSVYNAETGAPDTSAMNQSLNLYVYCDNNPLKFVDPSGLEKIVVAGGAYHVGNGDYQFEFVDAALKRLMDIGGGTLLVANAGWTSEQYEQIVQVSKESGVNLLWFSTIESLTNYINYGGAEWFRADDPITSFDVFAHATDADASGDFTGLYAITFGLYTNKDEQLRWYTQTGIEAVNSFAFSSDVVSNFYSCRTGNTFDNGNFAQEWADKTGGVVYAYEGEFKTVGRSEYSDILGTKSERQLARFGLGSKTFKDWQEKRGDVVARPGPAYRLPKASYLTTFNKFYSN